MIKIHEVKSIIKDALEKLNGNVNDKMCDGRFTIFESTVKEDLYGNLLFTFKEDDQSNDEDLYVISVTTFSGNTKDVINSFLEDRRLHKELIRRKLAIKYLIDWLEDEHLGSRERALKEIKNQFGVDIDKDDDDEHGYKIFK